MHQVGLCVLQSTRCALVTNTNSMQLVFGTSLKANHFFTLRSLQTQPNTEVSHSIFKREFYALIRIHANILVNYSKNS